MKAGGPNLGSYREVKAEILARIRSRDWKPGDIIPGEAQLALHYGCARTTVNRALRELAEAGIVERKRRVGTCVLGSSAQEARFSIPPVRHEIERAGAAYRYELMRRSRCRPPRAIAILLKLPDPGLALQVKCRHRAGLAIHQVEDCWINLETVPAAQAQSFEQIGADEWLFDMTAATRVRHVCHAMSTNAQEAGELGLVPGAAMFVLERQSWIGEEVVAWVRLTHPAHSYRLVAEMSREA